MEHMRCDDDDDDRVRGGHGLTGRCLSSMHPNIKQMAYLIKEAVVVAKSSHLMRNITYIFRLRAIFILIAPKNAYIGVRRGRQ